jgi:hypothetical protein
LDFCLGLETDLGLTCLATDFLFDLDTDLLLGFETDFLLGFETDFLYDLLLFDLDRLE